MQVDAELYMHRIKETAESVSELPADNLVVTAGMARKMDEALNKIMKIVEEWEKA